MHSLPATIVGSWLINPAVTVVVPRSNYGRFRCETLGSAAVRGALYGAFFASGLTALAYETIWQRMLLLFAGADAIASALVVGTFLAGLGIGSLIGGAIAGRLSPRGAVRGFAICELGIFAFALTSKLLYYDVLYGRLNTLSHSAAVTLGILFAALFVPTILMGIPLPLLAKAIPGRIEAVPQSVGLLYGMNMLGAGIGAFVTGRYLIGAVGLPTTTYIVAVLNFVISLAALRISGQLPSQDGIHDREVAPAIVDRRSARRLWAWCTIVFASGFVIISLEIIWFRVVGTLLRFNAYAFSSILTAMLLGDAVGILCGVAIVRHVRHPQWVFGIFQGAVLLTALGMLSALFLAHGWLDLRSYFVEVTGPPEWIPASAVTAPQLAAIALVVLPASFCVGAGFPIAQRAVQDDPMLVGWRVGAIQLANILGNAAGAFATGLALLEWLGTSGTLRVIGTIGLVVAAVLVLGDRFKLARDSLRPVIVLPAAALALAIVVFPTNEQFWQRLYFIGRGDQAIVGEDRTGVVVLRSDPGLGGSGSGTKLLYIGGRPQSSVPFFFVHGALGAIGPLVHPDPRKVLIIGMATGGSAYAAGVNPLTERIRVIEIIAPVYRVMRSFAAGKTDGLGTAVIRQLLADTRYEFLIGDARHFLAVDPERYDIIQSDAIYPFWSRAGMLYSVEFFRAARDHLTESGLFVQWGPTERTVASFLSVFPYVLKVGAAPVLIGSLRPIPLSAAKIAMLLTGSAGAYLEGGGYDPRKILDVLIHPAERGWTPADPRVAADVNTDLFPKDEFFANR